MSNQNHFEITQKIHQELDKLAKTTGIKIKSDFPVVESDNTLIFHYKRMTCFQIKQILIAFEEILGESDEIKNEKMCLGMTEITYDFFKKGKIGGGNSVEIDELNFKNSIARHEGLIANFLIKTQSEALCQKWLNGIKPLFDQNPTQVLTELLEVLQNIK